VGDGLPFCWRRGHEFPLMSTVSRRARAGDRQR
jgi:hypothetical protein